MNEIEIYILLNGYFNLKNIIYKNENLDKNITLINKLNNINEAIDKLKISLEQFGIKNENDFKLWYKKWENHINNLPIDEYRIYIDRRINHTLNICI